jgi:hypothetical protein
MWPVFRYLEAEGSNLRRMVLEKRDKTKYFTDSKNTKICGLFSKNRPHHDTQFEKTFPGVPGFMGPTRLVDEFSSRNICEQNYRCVVIPKK